MKEFRKNQEDNFVCEECGRIFLKKDGLSKHIKLIHCNLKYYFDKWLKEDEGICRICGKETKL